METITLQHTLPEAFAGRDTVISEVWHQRVDFQRGKIYLLEAASGTGKSSLCSFVYGYRKDYQGIISFDGQNIRNLSVSQWVHLRKNSLSMLFQELRLFGELTALENVRMKNALTGYCSREQITEWFQRLGIDGEKDRKVERMSFGQQQRVAFIRALCQPFDFIFLDEPISHLDEGNSRIMADILEEEIKKRGSGVVVTSIGRHLPLGYERVLKL